MIHYIDHDNWVWGPGICGAQGNNRPDGELMSRLTKDVNCRACRKHKKFPSILYRIHERIGHVGDWFFVQPNHGYGLIHDGYFTRKCSLCGFVESRK